MNIFKKISNTKLLTLGIITNIISSMMMIFYNHHFYDDEIYNLTKMSYAWSELFFIIQTSDVHPPLSYLLNKVIYDLFSSHKAILVFSLLLNVGALSYFYNFAEKKLDDIYAKRLLLIFVFINGGLLLWTNSVRWYAYWVPLFIILYTYMLKHQKLTTKHVVFVGLLLSFMTYINYLTFLLLMALLVLLLVSRRNDFSIKNILVLGSVYFSLSAYQIYIFIMVHMHHKGSQVSNILNSTLNAIYGIMNGGSVFLADPAFLLFSFFTFIIIVLGLKTILTSDKATNPLFIQSVVLFVVLFTLMVITGVAGKYRNNIALSIPFYFIISYFLVHLKNINLKRAYIFAALILSIISVFNLTARQNTAKNSYNQPLVQLGVLLQNPNEKIIVTYDPATYFYFENKGYKIHYLLTELPETIIEKGTSVYLIKTYQGSLSNQNYERVLQLYGKITNCMQKIWKEEIGIDKYYKIKNKMPGKRPKINQVQMHVIHGEIKNNCILRTWNTK